MRLQLPARALDLSTPAVMGILNVTPDSFSDGGRHSSLDVALARAREMVEEGARILDIGGESTRPGAQPVGEQQEMDRVMPVIEGIRRELDVVISIDTMKPAVMRAACSQGAEIVNDVAALRAAGAMEAVRDSGAAVCLMHMQGEPRTMQADPRYGDVVAEVHAFLQGRIAGCVDAGIGRERILIDPGFGFGKKLAHNLQLLGNLGAMADLGCPLLVGLSRKSMFGQLLDLPVSERQAPSLAAATLAAWLGAAVVRTHDVRSTVQAIAVVAAARQRQGV